MGVEMVGGFWAGAARAARTGRRRPKGAATKAAQFACAPKMLLHHVEANVPALTDRQLCQTAAYTAAYPTMRRLCQTKVVLPDLGDKDTAPQRKLLCQGESALPTSGGGFVYATTIV